VLDTGGHLASFGKLAKDTKVEPITTELLRVLVGEVVVAGQGMPAIVESAGARFAREEFFNAELSGYPFPSC
jgi:hypothetical protein